MHASILLISLSASVLLGNAEGIYYFESGSYPECTQRPFIHVHYDAARESLDIERLDKSGNNRGWQWLHFGTPDGKKQKNRRIFFGLKIRAL